MESRVLASQCVRQNAKERGMGEEDDVPPSLGRLMTSMHSVIRRVLPSSLQVQDGEPPPLPADFEGCFELPEHYEKPLQQQNRHALDGRLKFFAVPHVYTFDGVPTTDSVTSQAHRFEAAFDGKAAVQTMMMGKKQAWPRLEYVVDAQKLTGTSLPRGRGALAVQAGRTIAVCHALSIAAGANVVEYLRSAVVKGVEWDECDVELYSFARGMETQEIIDAWGKNAEILSHKGTFAHYLAELFFNGMPTRDCDEMRVLCEFCERHLIPHGLLAYNTEKEIVCQDADLAGSIDLIVFDAARGVHHLVDFKRSDKLMGQLRGYGSKKMDAPFGHLQDCKGAGYALQLSIYQYILEREYGLVIGDRVLVSLHPAHPFFTSVPYLKDEVEYIMQCRFNLVAARKAVARAHPNMVCSLSGAPLVDAVRLEDGTLVMEKMALIADRPYTKDADVRAAFAALVGDAKAADPPFDASKCTPWTKLMPATGIPPFAST